MCFITRYLSHLRADLRRQQAVIWKRNETFHFRLTEGLLADSRTHFMFFVFCFFCKKERLLFHFINRPSIIFPLMCFFLLFASGSEPPCLWMNRGRIGPQLLGIWALHCLTWGTHWYFCCLSFLIYSVGLKLQKACNCLPQLLKGYLISLCSALKIKNSMQVLIIIITQTRARSC